mmetsp:Transcript_37503/g.93224  ORF Transcript_37503/g.93224 Transcript_37503/m.93224 type:complete len:228 (+) Transcript_37503:132-815(+)
MNESHPTPHGCSLAHRPARGALPQPATALLDRGAGPADPLLHLARHCRAVLGEAVWAGQRAQACGALAAHPHLCVLETLHEPRVMGGDDDTPDECVQPLDERLHAFQVQVVRGLVQDEHVRLCRRQRRKQHARFLPAAEILHRRQVRGSFQPALPKQLAGVLLGETKRLHQMCGAREVRLNRQQLVEVLVVSADDQLAVWRHLPLRRLQPTSEQPEQRRFPASVWTH